MVLEEYFCYQLESMSESTGSASNDSLAACRKEVERWEGNPVVNSQVLHVRWWIEAEDEEQFGVSLQKNGLVPLIGPRLSVLEGDWSPLSEPLILRDFFLTWWKLARRCYMLPCFLQLIDRTCLQVMCTGFNWYLHTIRSLSVSLFQDRKVTWERG